MSSNNPTPPRTSFDIVNGFDDDAPSPWSDNVERYSLRSPSKYLISGSHLEHFATYLRRPYKQATRAASREQAASYSRDRNYPFAVLYDFHGAQRRTDLEQPSDVNIVGERNAANQVQSQILFMRGSPSPECLNAIGTAFDVDPEFFYHHLQLFQRRHIDAAWSWPPLASERARMFRLSLSTLAHLNRPGSLARDEGHMRGLRDASEEKFANYLKEVRREDNLVVAGDSLLRKVSVHDGAHLSFEQQVSVYINRNKLGWFAIVWLDVGTGFANAPDDEFFLDAFSRPRGEVVVEPTVFGRASTSGLDERPSGNKPDKLQQNIKHLCHDYHSGLDLASARADCLYALSKLLRFAAVSELCFLNMVKDVVRRDTYHGVLKKRTDASLSNLHYNSQVLKEHVHRLRNNVQALEQSLIKPKVLETGDANGIITSNNQLLDDFRDLLRTAEDCQRECEAGARSVMGLAGHAESQKAITQAKGVERLTRLGTIFLPLSLITSFFGMNSEVFGQGSVPLWAFFALAGPTFLLSLVFLFPQLWKFCRRKARASSDIIEMEDWNASIA